MSKASKSKLVLDRINEVRERRRALKTERYTDKEVLLDNVKVVGERTTSFGFAFPVIEVDGVKIDDVAYHRSATKGLGAYDLVLQVAPKDFHYKDDAGNLNTIPAGSERLVLKDPA